MRRRNPSRDFFEGGRAYTSFRRALRCATDLIAMAIYHLHVKVIGRKSGSSAVASAAYRSASRLRDERLDRSHDFSAKRGVVHSEVMLPENAPEAWSDRERLWNDVEAFEVRKDAQLAREVEFAIPREMTQAQGIELARDFVRGEFVDRGMIADLNVHWDMAEDGMPKPHAHVMLTMRAVDENGFGQKVRDWNRTEMVERWRERWAELANERLAELDIDARIDHRSLEAQGIALEPQSQIGAPAKRIEVRGIEGEGIEADRAEMHREIARGNGERIIADPSLGLDAITHQQSTFTRRDMAKFAHRHSDGIDQFNEVMGAMRNAPDLVELGKDARGEDRFTTREMIEAEQRLHRAAELMAERERHEVRDADREAALARAEARGLVLSGEQADALAHVTDGRDLGVVVGHAGTGKSAMLGVAREAWEAAGYEVRGVALSGIAAENLESGSGIASRTIASLEHGWGQGRDLLTTRDVLVIDEAGMVGTRQLERVLSHAAEAGAKVVLVGDPQQLQAIEAGAAFRSIHERHGGAEIGEVRRQREDWQRDATRDLATGRTGHALQAYRSHGMVHEAQTREQARGDLIERWDRDRQASPDRSRIILTHTNDEVRALNEAARERMRAAGDLGDEVRVTVERGARNFASGDRVMFLQNERGLGVKNGTLGTIEQVSAQSMTVQTDDGRSVQLRPEGLQPDRPWLCRDHPQGAGHDGGPHPCAGDAGDGCPFAAMSPCRGTATAWSCIMAATILPIRTGSPVPCRATAPRTWPRTTSVPIRYRATPSGVGSPSASAWPRSCARSCRRRCATCSTAFALLQMCPARMADGGRSGKRRKGKGAVREPSGAKPKRRKGRWRKTRKRNCAGCVPGRSCAMPAPWMRSSRRRRWAARQVPSR